MQRPSRKADDAQTQGGALSRGAVSPALLSAAYASVARALPYTLRGGGFVGAELAERLHADFSGSAPPRPPRPLEEDDRLIACLEALPPALLAKSAPLPEPGGADEDPCLMQALARCGTVELKTIDALSERLADHLAAALAEHYPIAPDMARYLASEARNEAIARAMERAPQERIDAFMADLQAHGRISGERVLAYARRGDSPLFHAILGHCAGLEADMVAAFIEDGGRRVLERILMRTDFAPVMREAILCAYLESVGDTG